jgi:hypothetical protein
VTADEVIAAKFAHVEREREDMHDYQVEDVQFLKDHPFSFGLLDLGLGKSVTAGTVVTDILLENFGQRVLILGPIAVIATSWPDELRSWRHLAPWSYKVLREDDDDPRLKLARKHDRKHGTKTETMVRRQIREELARSNASIHLANFEALEWLVEFWQQRWPYRIVIVDEAHAMKSHDSGRFKALARVRNTPGLIKRMHLLTATPASENYLGFFAMTYLLDGGQRFGKEIGTSRRTHTTARSNCAQARRKKSCRRSRTSPPSASAATTSTPRKPRSSSAASSSARRPRKPTTACSTTWCWRWARPRSPPTQPRP